jgi:hypothetical protein
MIDDFCLDIGAVITEKAAVHGICGRDVDSLLDAIDKSAEQIGIEPDSLYMILLDSLSGSFPDSKENVLHQIKVMLNNSNVLKCFPV